jgi:hypothetical protein
MKGLATGGVAGGLAGILLGGKTSKKMAKGAVKLGGTAALAGLAYKVYNDWQASKNAPAQAEAPQPMKDITPKPEGTPFLPSIPQARDDMSLSILRAMIAAAKADGHIDAAEQQKIFGKLDELDLDMEAKAFVMDELRKPLEHRPGGGRCVLARTRRRDLCGVRPGDRPGRSRRAGLSRHARLAPQARSRPQGIARDRSPQGYGLSNPHGLS